MGIRVIKTALAAITALYIAEYFSLEFTMSAALIAILGVDVTKKRGIVSGLKRIGASILGLLFAALIFYSIGFYIWVIGLFICVTYPILSRVNLKDGIVISSVLVLHIFSIGTISFSVVFNEIWLLLIGLTSATVFNLIYMPRTDKKLLETRKEVETLFSVIFNKIASHLHDDTYVWDGQEIITAHKAIEKGLRLAVQSNENSLFRGEERWHIYFHMREQQLESIQRMLVAVAHIYQTLHHGKVLAEVFEELSEDVKNDYYTGQAEKKLLIIKEKYKQMALPSSREEFEVRSALLQLSEELKNFLAIAKKEKKHKEQESG